MSNPYVSFVIIEYFSVDKAYECAESIKSNLTEINYEIIISSNSCYDVKTQTSLVQKFPDIRWIFNEKNGGFAYGMNQGLKQAAGTFLVISNPDVVVIDGLMSMINLLKSKSTIGAIGPMITDSEGNIQDSCRPFLTIQGFVLRQLKRLTGKKLLQDNFNYDSIGEVDWITGAFIMVTREMYNKTGGFDSSYFLYAEDMDLCTRIRSLGYKVIYYPRAKIIFDASRNARRNIKYMVLFIKSHFRYWRKFGFFRISFNKDAQN